MSKSSQKERIRKTYLKKKKKIKRPPKSYMPVFDNISTQLHCSYNNKSIKGILNILKNE